MNQIQKTQNLSPTYPPKLSPQDLRRLAFLASRMRMSLESGALHPGDLPTYADRSFLETRILELENNLVPVGRDSVDEIIKPLLMEMADRASGTDDLSVTRAIIANVLHDLPLFAVKAACEDFLFGRAGDGRWRPKAGEIRQRAEMYARRYFEELIEVRAVLEFATQKNVASSGDSRVAALIVGVAENMRSSRPRETRAPVLLRDVESTLAAKYRDSPPKLSSELRKKLG